MKQKLLIFIITSLPLVINAETKVQDQNITLKTVMKELGESMGRLNQGIFIEDYKLIKHAASEIMNHPKPKSQLSIIIKTLKFSMPNFKSYDSKVNDSAKDIIELANSKNIEEILSKHQVIMNSCVTCHTKYRSKVSKAFLKK